MATFESSTFWFPHRLKSALQSKRLSPLCYPSSNSIRSLELIRLLLKIIWKFRGLHQPRLKSTAAKLRPSLRVSAHLLPFFLPCEGHQVAWTPEKIQVEHGSIGILGIYHSSGEFDPFSFGSFDDLCLFATAHPHFPPRLKSDFPRINVMVVTREVAAREIGTIPEFCLASSRFARVWMLCPGWITG